MVYSSCNWPNRAVFTMFIQLYLLLFRDGSDINVKFIENEGE